MTARNNQWSHLRFLSWRLKLKKLPEPTRNNAENNNPHHPDHIVLTVLTTPPKYLSRKIGWILSKKLIIPVRATRTMPPTQNKRQIRSHINWNPLHWSIGRKNGWANLLNFCNWYKIFDLFCTTSSVSYTHLTLPTILLV